MVLIVGGATRSPNLRLDNVDGLSSREDVGVLKVAFSTSRGCPDGLLLRDGIGTDRGTTFSRPLKLREGLSLSTGVRSGRGDEPSLQLPKLCPDVVDDALGMVGTELLAEWGDFLECIRGDALLSVRGDFGGTFGGVSPTGLRAIDCSGFGSCSGRVDGIISGFNSFEARSQDRPGLSC